MRKYGTGRTNEFVSSYDSLTFKGIEFKISDSVKAFNSTEWQKTGDIGDNSQFYQEAEIIRIYFHRSISWKGGDWCADIKWKHNGEMDYSHFVSGLKKL